jgi:hypothetical protein
MVTKRELELEHHRKINSLLDTVARIEGKLELLLDHVGIHEITEEEELKELREIPNEFDTTEEEF